MKSVKNNFLFECKHKHKYIHILKCYSREHFGETTTKLNILNSYLRQTFNNLFIQFLHFKGQRIWNLSVKMLNVMPFEAKHRPCYSILQSLDEYHEYFMQ